MNKHFYSREFFTRPQLVSFINGNGIDREDIINLSEVSSIDKHGRRRVVTKLDFYHSGDFFFDFLSRLPLERQLEIRDNPVMEDDEVYEKKVKEIEENYNIRIRRNKNPPPTSIDLGMFSIMNLPGMMLYEDPQKLEFEKNFKIAEVRVKYINFDWEEMLVFVNLVDEPTEIKKYHETILKINDGLKIYYIPTSHYLSQKENRK